MAAAVAGEEPRREGGEWDRSGLPGLPASTTAEGEHKHVTVLCCHLADAAVVARTLGSERMLEHLDRFLKLVEEEVERFGGTISTVLSDGLVAVFGAGGPRGSCAARRAGSARHATTAAAVA
jgi:class 3 adenylate cyclase